MTEQHESSREEVAGRAMTEAIAKGVRGFRHGLPTVRITVVDDEHGRDVEVDDGRSDTIRIPPGR